MIDTALRVVLSLGAVLGLMWLVARLAPGRVRKRSDSFLNVVARQPLSRGASVSVVTVADRVLVVGVTEQGVNLLSELPADALPVEEPVAEPAPRPEPAETALPSFAAALQGSLLSGNTWRQALSAARTSRTSET